MTLLARLAESGAQQLRISWADLHGSFRSKTIVCREGLAAVADVLQQGVGMVSTVLLKDTADKTAFAVFEPGALDALPGFGVANNLLLRPDADSLLMLPWAPGTAWLRAEPFWPDGTPVPVCPRRVLQRALAALHDAGYTLRCGLEVEFHVYPIVGEAPSADNAEWPAEPAAVAVLHPGHGLLHESLADRSDEVLRIVQHTALGLGLPLRSLEVEFGPSQLEAVFDATDALTAADHMLLLRNGLRQALRRAGYHATFMCRPPLAGAMASGWHLHQSLLDMQGHNAMQCTTPAGAADDAQQLLSEAGCHWLAGLLVHAQGLTALCAPTPSAYDRYAGSPMAPPAAHWGRDNRGAMLRVVGGPGDAATRIENRAGEPLANPYLCIAAQVWAGLDGLQRRLLPPPATQRPYADTRAAALPTTMAQALDALAADGVLRQGLGEPMWRIFDTVKRQEITRRAAAPDVQTWDRRECFARF
jgi:glutamine synthetase